jgi:hypothetical protein
MTPSREWDTEREEHLVALLRRLALAEEEQELRLLRQELREVTGEAIEGGLSRWLAWYLEDHLGIRPALAVRLGEEERTGEAAGAAMLEDEVFVHPEYNWCALERVTNRDDMVKLRQLYADLEGRLRIDAAGPFSFQRLTGLADEELEFFRGKSPSECLFAEEVRVGHLRVLKEYGKLMMVPVLPSATQRAGAVIYAAAIAQALVRFNTKISSLSYQSLAESLESLLERPYVVESYARLYRQALERCA